MRYDDRLDAEGIRQASAQTHGFWGRGRTLAEHTRRNFAQIADSEGQCRYVGLRDEDGRVVSSLKWYELRFCGPPGEARAFGIGAVFTPAEQRGRGLATQLIEVALSEARCREYELSVLYSDIRPEFYERLGFVRFAAVDWELLPEALPDAPPLRLRRATVADETTLIALHERSFGSEWLWPRRPPKLWRYLRRRNEAAGDLLLTDGGQVVGYVNVRPAAGRLYVEEWAGPTDLRQRVWGTLRRLAEALGCRRVCGWERPGQTPPGARRTAREVAVPMIAALRPDSPWRDFLVRAAGGNDAFFGALDHF